MPLKYVEMRMHALFTVITATKNVADFSEHIMLRNLKDFHDILRRMEGRIVYMPTIYILN